MSIVFSSTSLSVSSNNGVTPTTIAGATATASAVSSSAFASSVSTNSSSSAGSLSGAVQVGAGTMSAACAAAAAAAAAAGVAVRSSTASAVSNVVPAVAAVSSSSSAAQAAAVPAVASASVTFPLGYLRTWDVSQITLLPDSRSTYADAFLITQKGKQYVLKINKEIPELADYVMECFQAEADNIEWLAKQKITQGIVVLKEHFSWKEVQPQLHPQTLAALKAFKSFQQQDAYILISEYGGPRFDVFTKAKWNMSQLCFFAASMVFFLEKFIDKGVVHGDLKPANIVLIPDPLKFTLVDMMTLTREGNLRTGWHLPSWAFRAPEFCSYYPTCYSDLWSLGVILYETIMDEWFIELPKGAKKEDEAIHLCNVIKEKLGPPSKDYICMLHESVQDVFSDKGVMVSPPSLQTALLEKALKKCDHDTQQLASEMVGLTMGLLQWDPSKRYKPEEIWRRFPGIAIYKPYLNELHPSASSAAAAAAAKK